MNETDSAIEKAKQEIKKAISDKTKKIAISVTNMVILSTPVDTGRARANWQVGINKSITRIKEKDFDKSGSSSINEGIKVISDSGEDTNKTIYISNNLPYIGRLNDGHSKQAPSGFIEKAVEISKRIK